MDGRIVALGIRGLKFRYAPSGSWVVNVPALDLQCGEQMLLTGGSGRGKSTLLDLIAGLIEPVEGRIFVGGADMYALREPRRDLHRARTIGVILQTFNLLRGLSAIENVMTPMMFSTIPRSAHRPRAEQLLYRLGIDRPNADPDEMNIAQQQRVAVARALACDPVLVLADEPTARLDSPNAAEAMNLLQTICREKNAALLCVTHDPHDPHDRTMRDQFEAVASLDDLAGVAIDAEEGL